jgi:hypothetical protein
LTRAPGAGHGEAGDAPLQGPAQEDVLSVQPKSANPNEPANAAIAIFETTSRDAGLVMTRPKPEKRKNAKERAKERNKDKFKQKTTEDGTTPMTATAKSEVESKAERKAATKVASKAAKAERKAKRSAAKAA